eukprot:11691255-Ditylum_brightwellii.AAC.1
MKVVQSSSGKLSGHSMASSFSVSSGAVVVVRSHWWRDICLLELSDVSMRSRELNPLTEIPT